MLKSLKIDFLLTENCNVNCSYCFDKNKNNPTYLTPDKYIFIFNELKSFIDSQKELQIIYITLFGGEITIKPEYLDLFLKELYKFINCLEINNQIIITTNGILYSKSIEDFMIKTKTVKHNKTFLAVSIGLSENDHNITRFKNYEIVKNNITKYYKNTNQRIIKKSVLSPYIFDRYEEFKIGFDDLKQYTILNWFFIDDGKNIDISKFKLFCKKFFKFYIETLKSSDFISFGSDRFILEIKRLFKEKRNISTNYNYTNSNHLTVCISPNGTFHSSHLSYFYRLDIYNNIDELYKNKNNLISNINKPCFTCIHRLSCFGLHIENSIYLDQSITVDDSICDLNKLINDYVYKLFKYIYINRNKLKKYKAFELYNNYFFEEYNLTLTEILKEIYDD